MASDLPTGVTEEDQDIAVAFGDDLSVHPESPLGRELQREQRLRDLGFDEVTEEQRATNATIAELDRLLRR